MKFKRNVVECSVKLHVILFISCMIACHIVAWQGNINLVNKLQIVFDEYIVVKLAYFSDIYKIQAIRRLMHSVTIQRIWCTKYINIEGRIKVKN